MNENKCASAAEACNLLLGLLIVAQFPIMFGMVSGNAVIQIIPWVLTAYPMILITVVLMYKNGDIVGATCNAVLSVVLMGQNFVKGILSLIYFVTDKKVPIEFARDTALIDGCAYLVGAVMLVFIGWLAFMGCRIAGVGISDWIFRTYTDVFWNFVDGWSDCRNRTEYSGSMADIFWNRRNR